VYRAATLDRPEPVLNHAARPRDWPGGAHDVPTIGRCEAVWVAAAIAVGLSGCAKKEPVSADARTLSEKLNPFVYYEIGS